MNSKMIIQEQEITTTTSDYISLTDIASSKNPTEPKDVVENWLRNKNTIEFLGLWEKINNPQFKGVESDAFRNEARANHIAIEQMEILMKYHTPNKALS